MTNESIALMGYEEQVGGLVDYFQRRRRACILQYKKAAYWPVRRKARAEALRYSALIRSMGVRV